MTMKLPSWHVYKWMDLEERESIHLKWCKKFNKDPNSEADVNEFFDLLDAVPLGDPAEPYTGKPRGRPRKPDQLVAK